MGPLKAPGLGCAAAIAALAWACGRTDQDRAGQRHPDGGIGDATPPGSEMIVIDESGHTAAVLGAVTTHAG